MSDEKEPVESHPISFDEVVARASQLAQLVADVHNAFTAKYPNDTKSKWTSSFAKAATYAAFTEISVRGVRRLLEDNPEAEKMINRIAAALVETLKPTPREVWEASVPQAKA